MKSLFSICIILFLMSSCNNVPDNNSHEDSTKEVSLDQSPTNCYSYAANNDTIEMKLIHVGKSITGTLVYKLYEKDKNSGTIQGSMRGDLLVADYTFMSEGVISLRHVVFRKTGNSFIEGHGPVATSNDRVIFQDLDSLSFNSNLKLTETPCQ